MIKFFRKLRQRLMSEGNVSKYLFYAIGEILLVVFGILIAVQINNWNQSRIDRIAEIDYLNRFVDDIQADTSSMQEYSAIVDVKIEFVQSILYEEIDSFKFIALGDGGQYDIFLSRMQALPNIVDNTFQEMTSSGRLGLIQNPVVKEAIFDYYRSVQKEYDVLSNKFSEWPSLISEFVDGLNPIVDYKENKRWNIPKDIEADLIQNLIQEKERLRSHINREVQYAIKQRSSYGGIFEEGVGLLGVINLELEDRIK